MLKRIFAVVVATASLQAMAACYTVYDAANKVIYRSVEAPVEMALPLSQTVPVRFGAGASMVVSSNSDNCPAVGGETVDVNTSLDRLSGSSLYITPAKSSGATSSGATYLDGTSSGGSGGGAHAWQTGPRGGVFYRNSSGGKTYASSGGGRRK